MNKYKTTGLNAVTANRVTDAAQTLATRMAKKCYGPSGLCRLLTPNSWSQDGSIVEFSAFIGYRTPGNPHCTTGHNVNFTVTRL